MQYSKLNLNDESKFIIIDVDILKLIEKLEVKSNRFLRILNGQNIISDLKYSQLSVTGSKPFGLSKVHKEGFPIRPILSAIGTPVYKLSKLLIPLI